MPTPELDDAELAMVIAALKEKLDRAGYRCPAQRHLRVLPSSSRSNNLWWPCRSGYDPPKVGPYEVRK